MNDTTLYIRPVTLPERSYTYSQSQQISMQTGFIGYLRADMDSNGEGFFSSWNDFRKDLKTQAFKDEFDEVINGFRDEGYFLHNRAALSKYCNSHPEASFGKDSLGNEREYGVRVNTDQYAYLMRLNPHKGEYNLYCYCYVREWLDRHLKQAERGIRFITPHYEEKFRLQDGDKIRITSSWGEKNDRTCRYIDDYHLEVGNNLYHILARTTGNSGYSLAERQISALTSELQSEGYYLAGRSTLHFSIKTEHGKKEIFRMLKAAESGKISAVFVFSIKHISQNHDLAFELVDRLNELGVIVYDNEGYQYSYDWYCKQIGKRFVGGCR